MTPSQKRLARLGLLALLIVTLAVIGEATGLRRSLTLTRLRALTLEMGGWGVAFYVTAFVVGEFLYVPGLAFVAAAIAVYGRLWGGALAWLTATLSVCVTFAIVRGIGGRPLGEIERPLIKKLMARMERRPVRTVILLRTVFIISPPLNYALALSTLSFADFLIGSAIGLFLPICAAAVLFDRLLSWLPH